MSQYTHRNTSTLEALLQLNQEIIDGKEHLYTDGLIDEQEYTADLTECAGKCFEISQELQRRQYEQA